MTQPSNRHDSQPDSSAETLEGAWNEARQRFVAGFPKRSDSIGYLLGMVATLGPRGPLVPLLQVVHRTAGLAGTVGFPTVSVRARELEDLLDKVATDGLDVSAANRLFEGIEHGFTVDLSNPPAWAAVLPAGPKNRRILVVEDDEDQREIVEIHLRAAGFVPIPVAAGNLVIDAARQHRPDLILLDANLPGLDGYSVCRLLKLDPDLSRTPVIFMTVRAAVDDKIIGLMLGADDYLTKPVDMTELVLRIRLLLEKHALQPEPARSPESDGDGHELDFESFVAVAREQLASYASTLALVRTPEARLMETYSALRADSRRRDLVACYGPAHIILLLVEMPATKAVERLTDIISRLSPGTPPRFQIGLASSPAPGSKAFETLLTEADEASVAAHRRGQLIVIAGEALPAPSAEQKRKGKVVLADDDPEVTRLIDAQLRAAGYDTVLAADGSEAVKAIEQFRPDVVIVDMMMPRMTGFDVLTQLRHQPGRPRTIVLSARGREQDVTRAFALGADDYMTKPFSPQELLARVERLLR